MESEAEQSSTMREQGSSSHARDRSIESRVSPTGSGAARMSETHRQRRGRTSSRTHSHEPRSRGRGVQRRRAALRDPHATTTGFRTRARRIRTRGCNTTATEPSTGPFEGLSHWRGAARRPNSGPRRDDGGPLELSRKHAKDCRSNQDGNLRAIASLTTGN